MTPPDNHILHHYASAGLVAKMRRAIAQGADVNANGGMEWNHEAPLMAAIRDNQVQAAIVLLKHHADPNCLCGLDSDTALTMAVCRNLPEVVRALVAAGADLDRITSGNKGALKQAVRGNNADMTALLLDLGANPDQPDQDGVTPLLYGLYAGMAYLACSRLIQRGANLELRNQHGETALMIAATKNLPSICTLLLQHGANLDARDPGGQSAEELAVTNKNPEIAEMIACARLQRSLNAASHAPSQRIASRARLG